jgi:hypothetical protein
MIQIDNPLSTASNAERTSYVLKWYRRGDHRCSWFIRGIKPDRSFYGEVTVFIAGGGKQVNAAGSLSESDYAEVLMLIEQIKKHPITDDPDASWDGLLAEGPVDNPRIIFRYRDSDHRSSEAGQRFMELLDLMAPYLRQFKEPSR